jgi:hypothetical protein
MYPCLTTRRQSSAPLGRINQLKGRKKKDPGIPSSYPFKEQMIRKEEERRAREEVSVAVSVTSKYTHLPTQRRHPHSCITIVPLTARLYTTPCATASNYCTCNSRCPLRIGACGHVVQPVALQLRKERQKQEVAGKRKMERKAVSASSLTQLQLDAAARAEAFEAAADAAGDGDDAAGGALPDASRKAYYKEFLKVTLPYRIPIALPHIARPHARTYACPHAHTHVHTHVHTHTQTHTHTHTHTQTHTHTHTQTHTHTRTHARTHGGAHQTYVYTLSAQHRLWMQRT